MSEPEDKKIDLASLFPSKGDPRRPPEWYGRALMYAVIAVFVGIFVYTSWFKITFIVFDVVIALFLALSVEPLVLRLIRHGWKRGAASVTCLVALIVIIITLFALFGNMFVQQMISMVKGLPALYDQLADYVNAHANFKMPQMTDLGGELMKNVQSSWVTNFAGQALTTTVGVFGGLLNLTTALMVAFYISIAGPRLRRSVCQWLSPRTQRKFLMTWTVVQDQISSFLFSRSILAAINATCTGIFLMIIKVPYWLPLALFCGVVSQFVPTIGTYLGGALPVLFAWGERGWMYAVGVVVFITVYQQIENLLLSPKISERTMDLNPCIAFLAVLLFGALFGALGAFLALPVAASIQVLFKVYTKRYQLVDMPLMNDPEPKKKSKVAEAADTFSEHVLKPMGERMPRQTKGSSAHVPLDDEIRLLQQQVYDIPSQHAANGGDDEDSPTVAIPKHVLDHHAAKGVKGLQGAEGSGDEGSAVSDGDIVRKTDTAESSTPVESERTDSDGAKPSAAATTTGTKPKNPRSQWS
ncbi:AI-2E family transporter [Bifidobacterium animalis]|uniref:AI-2E family transporter n=1 Tax=Bifidobacterium animalis TaxID=28025 RepID=UPI003F906F18